MHSSTSNKAILFCKIATIRWRLYVRCWEMVWGVGARVVVRACCCCCAEIPSNWTAQAIVNTEHLSTSSRLIFPYPQTPKPQILEVLFLHMLTPTPRHPGTPTPQHLGTSTPQHLNISVPQHLISNSTFPKRQAPTARSTLIIPCFSLLRACADAKNTSDFKNLQLFQCRFSKFRYFTFQDWSVGNVQMST